MSDLLPNTKDNSQERHFYLPTIETKKNELKRECKTNAHFQESSLVKHIHNIFMTILSPFTDFRGARVSFGHGWGGQFSIYSFLSYPIEINLKVTASFAQVTGEEN